jgi:3-hydroxyisobutyrate dehydrogenase
MKTGFIGLGAMGALMAANLARKGMLSAVHNYTPQTAELFAREHHVTAVKWPAEIWSHCDAVVICVSNDAAVLDVVRGKLVVDCSTVAPETAVEAAQLLAAVGARFVDAPINGGTDGARNGRLVFMVGGSEADHAAAIPLFEAMGAQHIHMGETGSGQATKAVNQAMAAGVAQAVTEGLAFAEALGLPMSRVIDALGAGAAGSWFVENRGRTMIDGHFPPGLKIELHHKDLTICQQMAAQLGGSLPSVDTTLAQYQTLMAEGRGEEDISALYRLNRRLFDSGH